MRCKLDAMALRLSVGSASGGWIDTQGEGHGLSAGSYLGMNESVIPQDSLGQPMLGIESECFSTRSEFGSLGRVAEDYLKWDSLNWSESLPVASSVQLENGFSSSQGIILDADGYAQSTEPILTTGTLFLKSDASPEKAYSPRRLRMPEPFSLAVWAILGAAWAGLAWHRRPSHRPSRDQGVDFEEGSRWNDQNRQAILQVIKKNRS